MNKSLPLIKTLKDKKWFYPLLDFLIFSATFFITFLIYILIFKGLGFYPFDEGGLTTMMSDQRDQYVTYMRTYQNALKSGENLVYSLSKVFGGDFQSLFTYYLASPFNLFVVFISSADIPAFFFYTSIIKMSFAAGNMYLLARYVSKKRRLGFLAFSIAYGLISYAFVYMFNFMFLDGLMILPLVTLGFEMLEKTNKCWLYPLSLGYALLTSWYIGAMICLYLVILFLLKVFFNKWDSKTRIKYLMRFTAFSLLGGLLASCTWICAFLHFDGTKASLKLPANKFFSWTIFIEGLLENNYITDSAISRNTGYMTMFVSVVTLLFAQIYFANKKYAWREKAIDGSLILVYFIVSISSVLNALFHGGREPTWFPGRYSFIIGFYLCYISLKEMANLEDTHIWGMGIPAISSAIILPLITLVIKNGLEKDAEPIFYSLSTISLTIFIISLAIILLYLLFILLANIKKIKVPKHISLVVEATILALTLISSYRGGYNVIKANVDDNTYQPYGTYLSDDQLSPVFNAVKENDSSLYRMESTFNRNGSGNQINNNPLFFSYNGLSHFSSTEKQDIARYMKRIGFHNNGFWEAYDAGSTEAINSFVGIKYLIDNGRTNRDKPNFIYNDSSLNLFKKMENSKEVNGVTYTYYENQYALPLGFCVDSSSSTYVSQGTKKEGYQNTYWYDHFEYQNEMFKKMDGSILDETGNKKEIFHKIDTSIKTKNDKAILNSTDEFGRTTFLLEKGARITYTFTIPSEAANNTLYIHEQSETSGFYYYLDGYPITIRNYWHAGIHSFNAKVGSTHTLEIVNNEKDMSVVLNPEVYYEDLSVLREYLTSIKEGGANNLKQTHSLSKVNFEGEFTLKGNNKEFLFTLPYDKNFSVYLDGKKKETMTRFDIFTAISLKDEKEGAHVIKIVYNDKGLTAGIIISSIAVIAFVPIVIFYPRLEDKIFKKKEDESTSSN